jgi:hypothetical protein
LNRLANPLSFRFQALGGALQDVVDSPLADFRLALTKDSEWVSKQDKDFQPEDFLQHLCQSFCWFDKNFRNGSSPPTEAVLWCQTNKTSLIRQVVDMVKVGGQRLDLRSKHPFRL